MKIVKKILNWLLFFFSIPVLYLFISFVLTSITIGRKTDNQISYKSIYLTTNGIHLDIIIPRKNVNTLLLSGIKQDVNDKYFSFGWGDENFYLNTPTWEDLTFQNAFKAMILKSSSLMHVTRYKQKHSDWIEIKISKNKLEKLNTYINQTFKTDGIGMKIILKNKGYSSNDNFYKSKGSYSCFNTCNSWVNKGFKESGMKCCLWTPFDFGLINKYE